MKIKINNIDRVLSKNGKSDVCTVIHYNIEHTTVIGKYDSKSETSSTRGAIGLKEPGNTFIEYKKLTEENVIKWVEDYLGEDELSEIKDNLEKQSQEKISPTKANGLPW